MKLAYKLEIIGLILILLSSFTQLFLLKISSDITNNSIRWKIERNMDTIYSATIANYQVLHPKSGVHIWTNSDVFKNYIKPQDDTGFDMTSKQTTFFNYLVACLFILGSILMVFAKYKEHKDKDYNKTSYNNN